MTCRFQTTRLSGFFSCFSTGARGVCAICFWLRAYPTVLTAPNWFTRVCFYAPPLQIEIQTHTRTHTKTHTHTEGSCEADNENEARKQWKRWTTGPEAQQTQRGDRSHTDTKQCKYLSPVNPPFKSLPDGQHSLMSSSIYRLPALSSAREVSTFRRCELRYLQRANCTKKPIKKMKYLDNKTQRLQKQMINWILD